MPQLSSGIFKYAPSHEAPMNMFLQLQHAHAQKLRFPLNNLSRRLRIRDVGAATNRDHERGGDLMSMARAFDTGTDAIWNRINRGVRGWLDCGSKVY